MFCGSDPAGDVHIHGYDVGAEGVVWIIPGGGREATPAEVAAIWGDDVPVASDFDET